MIRRNLDKKKILAQQLYLQGNPQNQIAEALEVSPVTISNWAKKGKWNEAKQNQHISTADIATRTLIQANRILKTLEDLELTDNATLDIANKTMQNLNNLIVSLNKISKEPTAVMVVDVFDSYDKYLEKRAEYDPEVDKEFIIKERKFQNLYILEHYSK